LRERRADRAASGDNNMLTSKIALSGIVTPAMNPRGIHTINLTRLDPGVARKDKLCLDIGRSLAWPESRRRFGR
jgi:hypothetical protein